MIEKLHGYTVTQNDKVINAIKLIENNNIQAVLVVNKENALKGVITNGDVRRFLLNGGDVNLSVKTCMNTNFRTVDLSASREEILKILDLGFGFIPRLDSHGKLIEIITAEFEHGLIEKPVLSRSRAPVRISFAGGGSDLTYNFIKSPGLVLSTTVALYCHVTLIPRTDHVINIFSEDLNENQKFNSLLTLLEQPKQNLITSVIALIKPSYGFDLYVRSDFPIGSGLGGSSAVATAVIAAFNELRLDHWSSYDLAELAFQAERLCFGVAGGWQDQYASSFGGINLIELGEKKNFVNAIRLDADTINELEECLILCDTGIKHDSSKVHKKIKKSLQNEVNSDKLDSVVNLCRRMHQFLIKGNLLEFGVSLHEAWELKKSLSDKISNSKIDEIYSSTINAGALGGKLLGAGAGGFLLFFVKPQNRMAVINNLAKHNCIAKNFKFENEGVVSWRTPIL